MAKFAALYDLPAGEQLLVVVLDVDDGVPAVQYATEVHGTLITATIPLCGPGAGYLERMAAKEEARNIIGNMTDDDVKAVRRKFVRDITGKERETYELEGMGCLPN